jgi:amidohydrolase
MSQELHAPVITGTVRAFQEEIRNNIEARMGVMTQGVATTFGLQSDFRYPRIVDPVINHPESTAYCQDAAAVIVGEENVRELRR